MMIFRVLVDLAKGFQLSRLGKALKWKIYYFIWFFCASGDTIFLGLGSTNFSRILRFDFSYETDFLDISFVAQKSSEMSTLSGSSPVVLSQTLAFETF